MSFTDLILFAVVFLGPGWFLWGIFARAAQRKVAGDILFRLPISSLESSRRESWVGIVLASIVSSSLLLVSCWLLGHFWPGPICFVLFFLGNTASSAWSRSRRDKYRSVGLIGGFTVLSVGVLVLLLVYFGNEDFAPARFGFAFGGMIVFFGTYLTRQVFAQTVLRDRAIDFGERVCRWETITGQRWVSDGADSCLILEVPPRDTRALFGLQEKRGKIEFLVPVRAEDRPKVEAVLATRAIPPTGSGAVSEPESTP